VGGGGGGGFLEGGGGFFFGCAHFALFAPMRKERGETNQLPAVHEEEGLKNGLSQKVNHALKLLKGGSTFSAEGQGGSIGDLLNGGGGKPHFVLRKKGKSRFQRARNLDDCSRWKC